MTCFLLGFPASIRVLLCRTPIPIALTPLAAHIHTCHSLHLHSHPHWVSSFCTLLGTHCCFRLQEKAALAKELNDKSTVLAGVKDKTKAYVEKLNNEKAAAVAALEEQVQ